MFAHSTRGEYKIRPYITDWTKPVGANLVFAHCLVFAYSTRGEYEIRPYDLLTASLPAR